MYPDGEVDCLHCGSCKFFGHVGPGHTPCQKRIDHVTVRFAHPWFKTYDRNQFTGVICSDFEPAERCVYLARTWRGFDYYWPRFLDQWGSGQGKTGSVAFTLDGNTKVRYHVKTEYFVFGDKLFVDGKLNAHERMFYVVDRRSPIGYRLVRQPWDPLAQPQTEGERIRAEILSRRKETAV